MKIDSPSTSVNIQAIASAAISNAAPPAAVPVSAPQPGDGVASGGSPYYASADVSDIFNNSFDGNLSEKLKDPQMQKEFDKVLDYANKLMFNENSVLKFSKHEATGITMVKLVNDDTKEVIKEFPPEKLLNIIAGIWEIAGLLVNKKA